MCFENAYGSNNDITKTNTSNPLGKSNQLHKLTIIPHITTTTTTTIHTQKSWRFLDDFHQITESNNNIFGMTSTTISAPHIPNTKQKHTRLHFTYQKKPWTNNNKKLNIEMVNHLLETTISNNNEIIAIKHIFFIYHHQKIHAPRTTKNCLRMRKCNMCVCVLFGMFLKSKQK